MTIALTGCRIDMPEEFPLGFAENSGNLIHGLAPKNMFEDCVHPSEGRHAGKGYRTFAEFANSECSHLVVTVANFFKVGDSDGERYARFQRSLEQYDIPIVIFGMGAQAKDADVENAVLPSEAVELMQFLGARTELIGLRGQFTADLFRVAANVTNTLVTGCPSFFQLPTAFNTLRERLAEPLTGVPAYAGTAYHEDRERKMLARAIREKSNMIEQVNKFGYAYHDQLVRGEKDPDFPWFMKESIGGASGLDVDQVAEQFRDRYFLFREMEPWLRFHDQHTSFSYGSRFHGNMAALLAGVPAVWVTHDSRTLELTDFLRLPTVSLDDAAELSAADVSAYIDYEPMFDSLRDLYANFNSYLDVHGLPAVTLSF